MKGLSLFILLLCSVAFTGNCSDSLFQKGVEELVNGNYESAQKIFQEDILRNPSFSNYYNLGVTAGNLEDWNKAKWAFESALKYEPLNDDVQYNAKFATQKITQSKVWDNPYSIGKQVIIGFGSVAWILLTIFFSLCVGIFFYVIFRKEDKNNTLNKWSSRLIVPAILLFIVSFYCVYSINNHFDHQRFAILKGNNSKFYISPNGVEANNDIDPSSRLQIMKYAKDSTWVLLKSTDGNIVWVEREEVYSY